jgi:hypothetical protein
MTEAAGSFETITLRYIPEDSSVFFTAAVVRFSEANRTILINKPSNFMELSFEKLTLA